MTSRNSNSFSVSSIARDDFDDDASLPVGEAVPYVSVYFTDGIDNDAHVTRSLMNRHSLEPIQSRDGSHIVWSENAKSGDLLPVKLRHGAVDEEDGMDPDENDSDERMRETELLLPPRPLGKLDELELLRKDKDGDDEDEGDASGNSAAALLLQALFLMFQGMLAGMSCISVTYITLTNSTFLDVYSSHANDVRRILFLLSSLGTIGSLDQLMSLASRNARPSLNGRDINGYSMALLAKENNFSFVLSSCSCLLYFGTLLMTIFLSSTDTLIYYKFGASEDAIDNDTWIADTLASSANGDRLTEWKQLVPVRMATAIIAWLCSCLLVWKEFLSKEGRGLELMRMQDLIGAWRRRVYELEGESLENLDIISLKKLQAIQALGYERTNTALKMVEQLA